MRKYRRERILIRFALVPSAVALSLRQDFAKATITAKERRGKNKGNAVIIMDLDDTVDRDKLCQFISRHKIPKKKCTLHMSLVTDQYMDGMSTPKFVISLARRIGCELQFTFTRV
jgi:hypothetical protein